MKKRIWVLIFVVLLALALPGSAFAGGPSDGRVILGDSYTLEEGDTLDGDLVVFGGNVTLEPESVVAGDVFVMGGNIHAAGTIDGDVAIFGGNINLDSSGEVSGDVSLMGGNLNREEGAVISGDVLSEQELSIPFDFDLPFGNPDGFDFRFGPFHGDNVFWGILSEFQPVLSLLGVAFQGLVLAALSMLVVVLWPAPADRAARAVVGFPLVSGGLGLLTVVMAPIMLVMLAITVILIPVSLLAAIVLVVATAFGWIAVGYEVGRRVAQAFQWVLQPAVSAGLGTLLLTFVIGAVSWVPCVGWIAFPLVGSLGLGAVLLTRFGSQDYHPAPVSYSPPAPAPLVARDPSEAQAGTEPESNLPALDESQEADETPAGEDETEQ